jgi:hypothetical protein
MALADQSSLSADLNSLFVLGQFYEYLEGKQFEQALRALEHLSAYFPTSVRNFFLYLHCFVFL